MNSSEPILRGRRSLPPILESLGCLGAPAASLPPGRPPLPDRMVLTPKEAADYLQVHFNTIMKLLRAEELRGRRVGRQWRILRSDLDAFMGNERTGTPGGRKR